jgi:hypothetical protein
MSTLQHAIAANDRPTRHDLAAEELLQSSLFTLARLSTERPGGVRVGELAVMLGFDCGRLVAALERGRHTTVTRDGSGIREPLVERVFNDVASYARSRYVLTACGRACAQATTL